MLVHNKNRIKTPQCCGDGHLWDVLDTEAPAQGLQDMQVGTVKGFQLGTSAPSAVRVTETHLGFQENLCSPGQWLQHPQGTEKPWWLRHSTRSTQHSWVQPEHQQFLVCPQVIPELANTRPEGEHGEGCWGWGVTGWIRAHMSRLGTTG